MNDITQAVNGSVLDILKRTLEQIRDPDVTRCGEDSIEVMLVTKINELSGTKHTVDHWE
jgi:hypothetical protein